jgi:mono/diheme cytochrome c family protein
MPITWIRPLVAAAVVAVISGGARHAALARDLTQESAKARTVLDGVYSQAQAMRGKERYAKECGSCHLADLSGSDMAPPLNGEAFIVQWEKRSVNDLFSSIRETMPQGTPGQLSGQAYAEIVAYLLQANAFPAGAEELAREADLLKTIQIVRRKP